MHTYGTLCGKIYKTHIRYEIQSKQKNCQEGDIVEVTWECPEAESARITIDNGYRSASVVPSSGSKI